MSGTVLVINLTLGLSVKCYPVPLLLLLDYKLKSQRYPLYSNIGNIVLMWGEIGLRAGLLPPLPVCFHSLHVIKTLRSVQTVALGGTVKNNAGT